VEFSFTAFGRSQPYLPAADKAITAAPSPNHRGESALPSEGTFRLVACLERELVGQLDIHTFPNRPRRRHAGQLGMAVCDEFQRRGVGTALLQAAVDLADKWLNLLRLELEVYSDHEPALRLYKRFGFAVEGTLVRYAYRAGSGDAHKYETIRGANAATPAWSANESIAGRGSVQSNAFQT
jgi:RimJ/RimL family protein N-acetyltransferase